MNTYVEQDCTIEVEGRKFTAGGAVVTEDFIVAYPGKIIPHSGIGCSNYKPRRELRDWHGNVIGTCFFSSTWETPRSWVSGEMHQIYATVNGVTYTGRGAGEGMAFRGRRVKERAK